MALQDVTPKNKIVIDEWDINSEQSKYRRTLSELAVEEMEKIFWEVLKLECYGCQVEHPSQRQHQCLMRDIEENVEQLFFTMLQQLDWESLNKQCCELTNCIFKNEHMLTDEILLRDSEWCCLTEDSLKKVLSY